MDLKSMRMFADLARSLHFAKTAELHHVSPSTLSRIIQRLEAELGCDLLHRDNRSVMLSEAGKHFLLYVEQHIEQWQRLQTTLHESQVQLQGKLSVFCTVTAAYSHLPPLLERFRQQHPLIEIMLTTGDAADALTQLEKETVDLAIAAKPEQLSRIFNFHHLAEIPLVVIAPTTMCKVQQQLQSDFSWAEIPIIIPEHGAARKRFEHWYRKKQQGKPNIYATVSGHEALVSMVALGCGVGIVPQVVVENSPVKDKVQYLTQAGIIEPFDLGICCLNQHKDQPIINAFFNAICE